MAKDLTFTKDDLPLWKGGTGSIALSVNVPDLTAPLQETGGPLLSVHFNVSGNVPFTFGANGSGSLGISGDTSATLQAFFPGDTDAVLTDTGEQAYLTPGNMVLALELGADAKLDASVTVPFADLTITGTFDTSVDVGYTYLKAFDATRASGDVLKDFFGGMALPAGRVTPLAPGEIITFEHGGYLHVGASVGVSYQIKGTPSMDWGALALSESYGLSVVGGIDFNASTAGRFRIEVHGIPTPKGMPAGTEWVRVVVKRAHSTQVGIAADAKVEFTSSLQGLPDSGIELLGAMLGVNTKNWFNYLNQVATAKSLADLQKITDSLAQAYLSKLVNKTWDQIAADVQPVLTAVQKITTAYQNFDTDAINLFDKYYDQLLVTVQPALMTITKLDSWNSLLGKNIPDTLAQVIAALTGADPNRPLTWVAAMAGKGDAQGLLDLQSKAQELLSQLQQGAHQDILQAIKIAKEQFGIDTLMQQLQSIDTPDALKQQATTLLGGFASRLIGKALTSLQSSSDFKNAFNKISAVASQVQTIEQNAWSMFQDAVNSTYSLALQAEYTRSTEDDALVDASFNLSSIKGRSLFLAACQGDFSDLLTTLNTAQPADDPNPVQLSEATFTHTLAKKSAFSINIVGWHNRFQYANTGLDQVLTNVVQHVRTNDQGAINMYTTVDLTQERQRSSGRTGHEETVDTKFLVHFLATSRGALQVDPATQEYFADCLQAVSAEYDLSLQQQSATRQTVDYYLGFANDFGIAFDPMTPDQVAALLPHSGTSYGTLAAAYVVTFTAAGVQAAFSPAINVDLIHTLLRHLVLRSFARWGGNTTLAEIGRAYATPDVYARWDTMGGEFLNEEFMENPVLIPNLPGQPATIAITGSGSTFNKLQTLNTLYLTEKEFTKQFLALQTMLYPQDGRPPKPLSTQDFKKKMEAFGSAVDTFADLAVDDQALPNPVFALFDQLVRFGATQPQSRTASLTLTATVGAVTVHQVYTSAQMATAAPSALAARV